MNNRFYIRTQDYLIEDRWLTGQNVDDKRYVYLDNIENYTIASILSNTLRKYFCLPAYDYNERVESLRKHQCYRNYPDIKDSTKKIGKKSEKKYRRL